MFGRAEKHQDLAAEVTDYTAVRGRSLMRDARDRFLANRAAIACMIVLGLIVAFVLFGPLFAVWDFETIDWNALADVRVAGAPAVETGHFFGTDESGRDLYSRVIQATRTSLLVGLIGAGMALFVGTAYGVIAGYVGGRTDAITP